MVLTWPRNLLETAVIPNTSNIRLLRFKQNRIVSHPHEKYWTELRELTSYHHNFWYKNNQLHILKSESAEFANSDGTFYKNFLESRSKEFDIYHRETWKRNINLLKTGYYCIFKSLTKSRSDNQTSSPVSSTSCE